jgi:hypothetical protein
MINNIQDPHDACRHNPRKSLRETLEVSPQGTQGVTLEGEYVCDE